MGSLWLSDVMVNKEVAYILDEWNLKAGCWVYLKDGQLYFWDSQEPYEYMRRCSTLSLAMDWLEILENRQSVHTDKDALSREQKHIDILRTFVSQEERQVSEKY